MIGYIYALVDPRNGAIRYIGQTSLSLKQRLSGHLHDRFKPTRKGEWMIELDAAGLRPGIVNLRSAPLEDLNAHEIELIAAMRAAGADLLNITHGGGCSGPRLSEDITPLDSQQFRDWQAMDAESKLDDEDRDLDDGFPPISQCTDDDRFAQEAAMMNEMEGGTFWTAAMRRKQYELGLAEAEGMFAKEVA